METYYYFYLVISLSLSIILISQSVYLPRCAWCPLEAHCRHCAVARGDDRRRRKKLKGRTRVAKRHNKKKYENECAKG